MFKTITSHHFYYYFLILYNPRNIEIIEQDLNSQKPHRRMQISLYMHPCIMSSLQSSFGNAYLVNTVACFTFQ